MFNCELEDPEVIERRLKAIGRDFFYLLKIIVLVVMGIVILLGGLLTLILMFADNPPPTGVFAVTSWLMVPYLVGCWISGIVCKTPIDPLDPIKWFWKLGNKDV